MSAPFCASEARNYRTDAAWDAAARRAARRVGLRATKSRWQRGSVDNYGEFMLVDAFSNTPVSGFRYDLSAEDLIAYCDECETED